MTASLVIGQTDGADTERIDFDEMAIDDPVTFMELADDGVHLILTHQAESTVTIYNIPDREIVAVLDSPSPRSVLGRDGLVIVADNISGTIR